MFTDLLKTAPTLLISVLPKVFLLLENMAVSWHRSFGGAQVSRTFYARGQTANSCC